jgi:outer membrane protein OmpA-like peptidoglycan-associated protein
MTISATNGTTTVTCTYVIGSATNCTLSTLTDGTWNITSTLTDPAGNTSLASSALPITIDATGPQSLTPDLVAASDSGSSSTDNATSDSTPTLMLTGQSTGDVITMNATNGTTTISCSYTVGSATNCTLPTLTDGSWNISASVTDTAGNTGTSQSLSATVDTTAPAAPTGVDLLASSDTGSSNTDNNTNDNTPTMSATGGANGDTMTISATNGTTTVTCTYVIGSATNCTLSTLTDGTWNITSTLTDAAGNTSTSSSALPVSIDGTAPAAPTGVDLLASSDTGSSNTDNNTNDNTPTMSATGGANGDTMTISATNGTTTVTCTYVIGSATNCTLPTLTDGTWNITSTLTDPLGNVSSASSSLPITIATTPPSRLAPDLLPSSDTGRSNSDNITGDTTPEMTIPGALIGDIVTVSATNGISIVACIYTVGSASSCSLPTLTEGTWSVSAAVTDAAGNAGPPTKPLSFTIDSKTSSSSVDVANTGALPSSTPAETTPVITPGTNSLTGRIRFLPNAGAKGASSAVFTVFDKSGKIVNFITKRLKPTDTSASVTVRNNGSLASIRVHTVNNVGVSQSARSGANVKRGKTSEVQLVAGLPKLRGDLLGEIMYFKPNSATLTPRTIELLNQVARTINSRGGNLFVSGFARKNGIDTPKYLRNLSEQRALAVSMYLSSKGVRLWTTYQGFGAVTTEIGTPAERRVELRWVAN